MKKWLSILMAVMLIVTLSACGNKSSESSGEKPGQPVSDTNEPPVADTTDDGIAAATPGAETENSTGDQDSDGTPEGTPGTEEPDEVFTELDATDEAIIEIGDGEGVGDF